MGIVDGPRGGTGAVILKEIVWAQWRVWKLQKERGPIIAEGWTCKVLWGGSNKALGLPILSHPCCPVRPLDSLLRAWVLIPGGRLCALAFWWYEKTSILYPMDWLRQSFHAWGDGWACCLGNPGEFTVHSPPSTTRLALPLCLCLPGSGWGRRGTGCWRRWLVAHLPSWAGICLLPLLSLQLEFSMGRWKHGFPPLIPFLATNSVGWGGLASIEMRKRTIFLAGSREERFNLFSLCVHVCVHVCTCVWISPESFFSVE